MGDGLLFIEQSKYQFLILFYTHLFGLMASGSSFYFENLKIILIVVKFIPFIVLILRLN